MKNTFFVIAILMLTSCGITRTTKRVKFETHTIERIDTTVAIRPVQMLATFDSVTTTRQTIQTPKGRVSIQRNKNGSTSVECDTDTVFVDVFIERETTTKVKKKDTTIESHGVRLRWFLFGVIAVFVVRLLLSRSPLRR